MRVAIDETDRRRAIQEAYNLERGIEPTTIVKGIRDLNERLRAVAEATVVYTSERARASSATPTGRKVEELVARMEAEMRAAAKQLEFERAAALRDEIQQIRLRVLAGGRVDHVGRAAERAARGPSTGGGLTGRRGSRARRRGAARRGRRRPRVGGHERDRPAGRRGAGGQPRRRPRRADIDEGTVADWLPGIRDEHEDEAGWQARWLDRPTWDRTVTPNIRKRTGQRPGRRR